MQLPFYECNDASGATQIDMIGEIKSLKLTKSDFYILKTAIEKR